MRRTVLLIALLAFAGCGSSDSDSGGGNGGGSANKTAIYVSTNPLGTNQFLNLIADGAKAGGKECGVDVKVVQSSDPNSLASNLRAAAGAKPDLLIANSFDSVETIGELAKQNPDQKWALVDATVENTPNLRGILFKENEGMYLIGAAFASLAKGGQGDFPASKSLGFVGAVDNALVRRWLAGYEQGVKDTDAGAKVQVGWAGSYTDPATSKELAISQQQKGAKYIAGVAAAGNAGVFEAAGRPRLLHLRRGHRRAPQGPGAHPPLDGQALRPGGQGRGVRRRQGLLQGRRRRARGQGGRGRARLPHAAQGRAEARRPSSRRTSSPS